jgi:hypothetical protein
VLSIGKYASSHGRALALPGPLILLAQATPQGRDIWND